MSRKTIKRNKGIASVFGTILILIIVVTVASLLFVSLYLYEEKAQESIVIEEQRAQEKIVLLSISTENVSGAEYLEAILINNTGTIISRIRAIYIDNSFICDPTDPTLNPNDAYINPKDSLWIQFPSNHIYDPLSKIEVATERGVKAVEYAWKLKSGSQAEPPPETMRTSFGPLLLNFEKFYYAEYDGSFDSYEWKPGWSVEKGTTLVWNITVTNIDDRDLTINKYSGFTLVSNDGGVQLPWFIEPPNDMDTLLIPANTTTSLIYIWDCPRNTQGASTQSVYNQNDRSKVFLTFFGIFHETDGTTKPYGQTIPFEAVLIRDPQMVISANPTTLAAGSAMTSTITVTVRDITGILAPNVVINWASTLGTLSSPTSTTNSVGVATITLSPGTTLGTATVIATWGSVTKSINITIATGTLTLTANPTVVSVGSAMTSTITARVTLGTGLPGETVSFSTDLGTVSQTATTNTQGYATAIFASETARGTATVTASWGTLTQTVQIHIFNNITVSPAVANVSAGQTQSYTATASDSLGNSWPITNQVIWSTDPAAGGAWNGATYTSENAGTWTVEATLGGVYGTATLNVDHSATASITVAPLTATLTAGEFQVYTATAADSFGNTWDVTAEVTTADGWSIDSKAGGDWTGDTYISEFSGEWTVTALLGSSSGTASLTVNPAALDHIVISTATSNVIAGSTQTFTTEAFDGYDNSLGDVTASTTWNINPEAGGGFTGATYTSEFAGIWTVTGTYSGIDATASLTVTHDAATSLSISPPEVTLTAGQSQPYTAIATDYYGNTWDSTNEISAVGGWSISIDAGGQWTGATYTSGNAGDWTVTATLGGASGTSSLHVE
jgi:hypothetical protein